MTPDVNPSSVSAQPMVIEGRMEAIGNLHESHLNPRKYFAEGPMQELTESIEADGIRVPIIVRSRIDGDGYEIAAGHRRYRAAKCAGLTHVPVLIREMSDEQFLKFITFDNLLREDVHPMEEAEGLDVYMREALADVASAAASAGKSSSWVYQRLKLLELIPEARRAFQDNKINSGHAILIARRSPRDQARALRACQPPEWNPEQPPMSSRDLADWMKRNLDLDLKDANFPIVDAELLPEAGACTSCPHRLGNQPDFDAINDIADICTHSECYERKAEAFVVREEDRLRAEYGDAFLAVSTLAKPEHLRAIPRGAWWDAKSDPSGRPALLIDGDGAGTQLRVLLHDPNAAPKPAPPPAPVAPQPAKPKPTKEEKEREAKRREEERKAREEEEARQKREREEREAKLEKEKGVRKAILKAILDKTTWPPKREEFLGLLGDVDLPEVMDDLIAAQGVNTNGNYIHTDDLVKCSDNQLARFAVLIAVSGDFDDYAFGHGCDKLYEAAKRYGVDHRKIRAEAEGGTRKAVVANLPALNAPAPTAKNAPAKKVAAKKSAPAAKKAPAKKAPAKKGGKK